MNFLNALERIPKLVETVGGLWKKEDELKVLKAEVAAHDQTIEILQKKIQHP